MKKSDNKIRVSFTSNSAESVAGSQVLIEWGKEEKRAILVECGLIQENCSLLKEYQLNTKKFAFKPKNINYVFACHLHIDHIGAIPRLYKEGCNAPIIMPTGSKAMAKEMLLDSANIMRRDAENLTKRLKKEYDPIYTPEDVYRSLNYLKEYERENKYQLDDDIEFQFIPSGHIINSCQLILWIKSGNQIKKIAITSDLGNNTIKQYYVDNIEYIDKANLLIGETTYANAKRSASQKDRDKDLEKIKAAILTTCDDRMGKVLIPVFSLQRCQQIVTNIYDLFYEESFLGRFNHPVYIGSPLASKISKLFLSELRDDIQRAKWEEVLSWKNLKIISDFSELESIIKSDQPCVLCCSAGMMNAGYSVYAASQLLPNTRNQIIFVGYAAEGSLARKIKDKKTKTVTIEGKPVPSRCNVINLNSFSSHMTHEGLLNYYSTVYADKIALVHGEMKDKEAFSKELKEEIAKKNRTGKVVCVNKSTELLI